MRPKKAPITPLRQWQIDNGVDDAKLAKMITRAGRAVAAGSVRNVAAGKRPGPDLAAFLAAVTGLPVERLRPAPKIRAIRPARATAPTPDAEPAGGEHAA